MQVARRFDEMFLQKTNLMVFWLDFEAHVDFNNRFSLLECFMISLTLIVHLESCWLYVLRIYSLKWSLFYLGCEDHLKRTLCCV